MILLNFLIEYNKNKNKITESIQEDLELKDKENTVSLYNYVYEPKSKIGKKILEKYADFYTDDVKYLQQTQNLIKKSNKFTPDDNSDEILTIWDDIKNDKDFR